jgi:hypothetical protein
MRKSLFESAHLKVVKRQLELIDLGSIIVQILTQLGQRSFQRLPA